MEPFIAAIKAAEKLTDDLAAMTEHRDSLRHRLSASEGEKNELRGQVDGLAAALSVAVDTANIRKNMVVELTAQISMLGKLFIHCSDEVVKIVAALPRQPAPEDKPAYTGMAKVVEETEAEIETTITGTENMEVELVGPLVGEPAEVDKATIPFAQKGREHLLSETVIPAPAFLHKDITVSPAQLSKMTYLERRNYVKDGIVPRHIRRFSSG